MWRRCCAARSKSSLLLAALATPHELWWFAGERPDERHYATSMRFTADCGSGCRWSVVRGAGRVRLRQEGSSLVVEAASASLAPGDVVLALRAGVRTYAPIAITVRAPAELVPAGRPRNRDCHKRKCELAGTRIRAYLGYATSIAYRIRDQFGGFLTEDVPVNEQWASEVEPDHPNANWRRGPPRGVVAEDGQFRDLIQGEFMYVPIQGTWQFAHPTPGYDALRGACGRGVKVHHWSQEWRVGSSEPGKGRLVQVNTLVRYQGHGCHEDIRTGGDLAAAAREIPRRLDNPRQLREARPPAQLGAQLAGVGH